jgi:hypothetical protein
VSASVDSREYRLQSEGLGWALRDPEVRHAFLMRPEAPVWLAVFEWSGATYQRVIVGWTAVTDEGVLDRVAAAIEANPAPAEQTTTAIGAAMLFAGDLIAEGPLCASWTLDISGDGQNNDWPRPEDARNDPRLAAVTINGLVIGADFPIDHALNPNRMGALTAYYRNRVIKGPGAFVETADDFRDFGPTMRRKLIRELANLIVGEAGPGSVTQPDGAVRADAASGRVRRNRRRCSRGAAGRASRRTGLSGTFRALDAPRGQAARSRRLRRPLPTGLRPRPGERPRHRQGG